MTVVSNLSLISTQKATRRLIVAACFALPVPAAAQSTCRLSYDRYLEMKNGMTIAEADRAMGCAGKEMAKAEISGITVEQRIWQMPSGPNVVAQFTNGAMTMKVQAGL